MNELINKIEQWGADKGILEKATDKTQFQKLEEEVTELYEGIWDDEQDEVIDAIGDCAVVLILLAKIRGTDFNHCLQSAYDVIAKRTGKMVEGVFVKDLEH